MLCVCVGGCDGCCVLCLYYNNNIIYLKSNIQCI